MSILEGPTK